jgi:hypothetical protein
MRRTFTFISVFALMMSMLALPAASALELHCPGANASGAPALPEGYSVVTDNEAGDIGSQETASITLPAGTYFCVKAGDQASGILLIDDVGVDNGDGTFTYTVDFAFSATGNPQAISYYMTYNYTPPFTPQGTLGIEKTGAGLYDRNIDWDLSKTVNGGSRASFSGVAGDQFPAIWEVIATKNVGNPTNLRISGEIEVTWSGANYDVTVDVSDSYPTAVIDCDPLAEGNQTRVVLEAETDSVTCSYSLAGVRTTSNTATATAVSGVGPEGAIAAADLPIPVTDTATIGWTENRVGDDIVGLGDVRFDFYERISETTTKRFPETFACPTDRDAYDENFKYSEVFVNTATLIGRTTDLTARAGVILDCSYPWIGETATGEGPAWSSLFPSVSNWFMISRTTDLLGGVDIIAGQHYDVGDVRLVQDGDKWYLDFKLEGAILADVSGNVKIQPLDSQPSKYIQPGQFQLKPVVSGTEFRVEVPYKAYGYAIHLDVLRNPDLEKME